MTERGVACARVWDYLRGYNASNASYLASCDGLQGYFFAQCLEQPQPNEVTQVGTALHLPWPKFHVPSRGTGARTHSSVLHPDKRCLHDGAWFHRAADAAGHCNPAVPGWNWNQGQALLPFPFDLGLSRRPRDGSPVLGWTAWNLTSVRRYRSLHADRATADARYCDELPCDSTYTSATFQRSLLAKLRAAAGPLMKKIRPRQQLGGLTPRRVARPQAVGARAQTAERDWRARKAAEDAQADAVVRAPMQDAATLELLRAARRALDRPS